MQQTPPETIWVKFFDVTDQGNVCDELLEWNPLDFKNMVGDNSMLFSGVVTLGAIEKNIDAWLVCSPIGDTEKLEWECYITSSGHYASFFTDWMTFGEFAWDDGGPWTLTNSTDADPCCVFDSATCQIAINRPAEGLPPRQTPPSLPRQIWSYTTALARWEAAGRPKRTTDDVKAIYDEHCTPCEHFDPEKQSCRKCGCKVRRSGRAMQNKIAMATEHCPMKKW